MVTPNHSIGSSSPAGKRELDGHIGRCPVQVPSSNTEYICYLITKSRTSLPCVGTRPTTLEGIESGIGSPAVCGKRGDITRKNIARNVIPISNTDLCMGLDLKQRQHTDTIPDSPFTRRRHTVSSCMPSGETRPRPVTTTLRWQETGGGPNMDPILSVLKLVAAVSPGCDSRYYEWSNSTKWLTHPHACWAL